ncbi:glycosyl transferase, group 1 [Pseudozyma hubeiensis SY62]|uniref:Glycosyl transferase, group 1 n=1 Tax=Pseudozyma hubeiensis (strain SY62) TaxID=1305764 RepID=R9PAE6_PSEHS|nr:glycosyl transferase, group 1 [Pseudozyma hubeiensis SY62]GAC98326.1 glycosyl transferase, group 1 [Pseudozyma hubeiensis SY62]
MQIVRIDEKQCISVTGAQIEKFFFTKEVGDTITLVIGQISILACKIDWSAWVDDHETTEVDTTKAAVYMLTRRDSQRTLSKSCDVLFTLA